MGWRRRAYYDQWPGRGPFSHLPPWQRPGRAYGGRGYGRGWSVDPRVCGRFPGLPRWWWADPAYTYPPPAPTPQDELAALEDSKKELGEEKASVEQEISDIETQIRELNRSLKRRKSNQRDSDNCKFLLADSFPTFPYYRQIGEKRKMLSKIPIKLEKIAKEDLDKEIVRAAIIAELDAVNLYEQMAASAENKYVKQVLLDIAKEEKTHVGEFQTLLLMKDKQQEKELVQGKKEIEELTKLN